MSLNLTYGSTLQCDTGDCAWHTGLINCAPAVQTYSSI